MHTLTPQNEALARRVFELALQRRRSSPALHGMPPAAGVLDAALGSAITDQGLGGEAALRLFSEHIVPACVSNDHPGFLSFIPHAPTEASIYADWLLSAFPAFTGAWDDGAGVIAAENAVLTWLARLAGLPARAGGSFVPGATLGTLAALHAARSTSAERRARPPRWAVLASADAHASVAAAARVLDVELLQLPTAHAAALSGTAVRGALRSAGGRICAVVATAGTTQLGLVDDLPGIAAACRDAGVWLHVDAAYGGAVLVSRAARAKLTGIEAADSLVIDPHKWLFAPYDSCALLFREPAPAAAALAQHADYLDTAYEPQSWHPFHYGIHLSRRGRGLPLWWSLVTYGTAAYERAIDASLALAQRVAQRVRDDDMLALAAAPNLSVVGLFRRGWNDADYRRWAAQRLRDGVARVAPAQLGGRPMLRLCLLNPRVQYAHIEQLLQSLRE